MRRLLALAVAVSLVACGRNSPPAPGAEDTGPVAVARLPAADIDKAAAVTVPVPAGTAQVRFVVGGVDRPALDLTAELESAATGEIRRWPVDEAPDAEGRATVTITVPVYAVAPGAHRLRLWAGDAEVVGRYDLEVVVP